MVCQSVKGCSRGDDGLLLCRKRSGNVPGFRWLSKKKPDAEWQSYRADGDSTRPPSQTDDRPRRVEQETDKIDWSAFAKRYAANMTPRLARRLAEELRLPVECLRALPLLGYNRAANCYTFPECDGDERIIGLTRRFHNGVKWAIKDSTRGLTIPLSWRDSSEPLRIVEGSSDVLALAAMDIPAIGRPSARQGAEMIIRLLDGFDREIVVVGENDQKPGGTWPGRDGAEHVATKLRKAGLNVEVKYPPDDCKDAREWVVRYGWESCQIAADVAS